MKEDEMKLTSLEDAFSYHAPKDEDVWAYGRIRAAAREFASVVLEETPQCPDQTAAVRKIREAMMMANAARAIPSNWPEEK